MDTEELAPICAACGTSLRDDASIKAGMGPDCRARFYDEFSGVTDAARDDARQIILGLSSSNFDPLGFPGAIYSLQLLGLLRLADRIRIRARLPRTVQDNIRAFAAGLRPGQISWTWELADQVRADVLRRIAARRITR